MVNLLPFGGVEVIDALEQRQCVVARNRSLFRVDFLFRFDVRFRKKLLRSSAAGSARAVVAPIEFYHECFSSYYL